ncbi:MAG: cytochrome c oxidase subunit II [Arcobacter sp.]|uniref:cytochrome c oxidase subunit II n=1 Tax=Arcobacter sp. TaxID=1872629 RepID=UPI003AFFED8D
MLEGMEGVSSYAADVDRAFLIVNVITLFLFVVTIGSMLYFVYRYKASKNPPENAKNIEHYTPIEIIWTVVPTILLGIVFYFGLDSLRAQRTMPNDNDSIVVKVIGQRWSWNFEYENGKKSSFLMIPANKNIKLKMTAPVNDVLHSFYVPAFRAKEDVVPGQITQLWFNINKKGKYDIQCAEYCGMRHSYMLSHVEVVDEDKYNEWLNPKVEKEENSKSKGEELFSQHACVGCHSMDGSILVGPSLKDIYNKKEIVVTDSKKREIIVDDEYLKNSILDANKDIVEGFTPNLMPNFEGVLSEDDVKELIKYIKGTDDNSDKTKEEQKISGKELVQNNGCIGCHSLDGSKLVGPSFKGIYGRVQKITINNSLKEIIVDDEYLKSSILKPNEAIVEGYYAGVMPSFENVLSDKEIEAIIKYLKTIK